MRFIYVDEAGVSAHEPVTIVAGLIVHADRHWRRAEALVDQLLDQYVPAEFRKGFVFHAKTVWAGNKYGEKWSLEKRLALIHGTVSAPRLLKIPISFGLVRREATIPELPKGGVISPHVSKQQFQHSLAFWICMARADKYICEWAAPEEVATVVAEDVPDMRKYLRWAVKNLRNTDVVVPAEMHLPTAADVAAGRPASPVRVKCERIIDTVHFVEKTDAPLLQMADACAFSLRRFFSKQHHGDDLLRSLTGSYLFDHSYWAGMSSGSTIGFEKEK